MTSQLTLVSGRTVEVRPLPTVNGKAVEVTVFEDGVPLALRWQLMLAEVPDGHVMWFAHTSGDQWTGLLRMPTPNFRNNPMPFDTRSLILWARKFFTGGAS